MGNIIDKNTAVAVSKEIKEAVEAIFAKHGMTIGKANTTYGDFYKFSIEGVMEVLENGVNIASKEASAYNQLHNLYDLPAGLLGKTITVNGKQVTFIGIATSRKKYPYAFRKDNGETVLYTEAVVPKLVAGVA